MTERTDRATQTTVRRRRVGRVSDSSARPIPEPPPLGGSIGVSYGVSRNLPSDTPQTRGWARPYGQMSVVGVAFTETPAIVSLYRLDTSKPTPARSGMSKKRGGVLELA